MSRDVYNAANMLKSSRQYSAKSRPLPVLSVVDGGILQGYVPVDKNWSGFSVEDYQTACESVKALELEEVYEGGRLFMGGYKKVRAD